MSQMTKEQGSDQNDSVTGRLRHRTCRGKVTNVALVFSETIGTYKHDRTGRKYALVQPASSDRRFL